jgi:hypothetical protein
VCAALIGALCGAVTAAASNITLKYDVDINSGNQARIYDTDPGSLVAGGNFLIGFQPDWAEYTGEQALPGGTLTFNATYGPGSFTANGTATVELYGSTLNLSTGTASYNSYEATSPIDFGSLTETANAAGDVLTVAGSAPLIAAFDAGELGTITSLFLGSPVGNLGENYVDGIPQNDEEVFSIPLTPAVPEPSTWALVATAIFALVLISQRYRHRASNRVLSGRS